MGRSGQLDVFVDGTLVFSKKSAGRSPARGELPTSSAAGSRLAFLARRTRHSRSCCASSREVVRRECMI